MPSAATVDWAQVAARARPRALMGSLWRIVESQEQKATVPLVDGLEEHDVLEQILEASKPPLRSGTARFDYLLRSPWRYPPLRWGSRFGTRFQPSIFYGALSEAALFAEAAYYRFVFFSGMSEPFSGRVISEHTVFQAKFQTERGMDLTKGVFTKHKDLLCHPSNYSAPQALGEVLRETGIHAFTYWSARTATPELNIGLIEPVALRSNKHQNPVRVICESREDAVQYRYKDQVLTLQREQFLVDGEVPTPAA